MILFFTLKLDYLICYNIKITEGLFFNFHTVRFLGVTAGDVFAPHQFGIAEQDINCRCRLSSVPRWDLDNKNFTRKNNITGEIIPYKTYENWKKEYLKKV